MAACGDVWSTRAQALAFLSYDSPFLTQVLWYCIGLPTAYSSPFLPTLCAAVGRGSMGRGSA